MNRTLLLACLAVLLLSGGTTSHLHAGNPFTRKAGKGFIHIYGGSGRTSNYFNSEGTSRLFDTLKTSFSATTFGASFDYGLTDDLELNAELPVGYFALTSRERFPDRSIFAPIYFGVGATYQVTSQKIHSSLSAMVKIPPGFHNGIYDDPAHPTFLSDGYLQVTTAFNIGFTHKDIWLKGSVGYNWRDEEPLDEILYSAEVGLSKVEDTGIFLGFDGVLSTGDVSQPLVPFYAGSSGSAEERQRIDGGRGTFRTIDRENYFAITAGAFIFVSDHVMLDGRYIVRLFGQNSLALQGGYLGVGYRF